VTPTLLREAGESLYGSLWQSALARDLGVNDRTVRRWAAGESRIPAGVWAELHKILALRELAMAAVRLKLYRARERTTDAAASPASSG
jgi:DNA-binding transcriptional regulator YdaS (Cro superfamily)